MNIEQMISEIEKKHGFDYGAILVGLVTLILAISQQMYILLFITAFALLIGVVSYNTIHRNIERMTFIKENYSYDPAGCLTVLDEMITELDKAIAVDQRKADSGGRDSRDSQKDVERKMVQRKKFVALRDEIEKRIVTFE